MKLNTAGVVGLRVISFCLLLFLERKGGLLENGAIILPEKASLVFKEAPSFWKNPFRNILN